MSADSSDPALVYRAQLGERAAFDLLVLRYQRRIFKLTLRYTRNPADAEDASQEAFIKAYRGLRRFRGECTFYTWLHRIAINCAKNVLTARARDPLVNTFVVPDDDDGAEFAACLRELETPEDLTVTNDIRSVVNAALEALPEAHRTVIIAREVDGLSYEQIAACDDHARWHRALPDIQGARNDRSSVAQRVRRRPRAPQQATSFARGCLINGATRRAAGAHRTPMFKCLIRRGIGASWPTACAIRECLRRPAK